MSETMVASKSYETDDFLSTENEERADEAVGEVFSMMLGFEAKAVEWDASATAGSGATGEVFGRTAIVGFSGAMRGSCEIRMDSLAAHAVCSAMIGDVSVDEDESIDDAVGELCNMLAGGWKNRVPTLSSSCALSPPTVISGRAYKVHMSSPSTKFSRSYQFDVHALHLTLHREDAVGS
jgi:chemotaxis protein CheX